MPGTTPCGKLDGMRRTSRIAAAFAVGLTLALVAAAPFAVRAAGPTKARPAQGRFLVASPRLIDPNFARTIVLLTKYGPEGAMGFVVNHPTDVSIADVVPEYSEMSRSNEKVYVGGPVRPHGLLFFVRTQERPKGSQHIFEDVYLSGNLELLEKLVDGGKSDTSFRVYAGYAGWAAGQLEAEIARGDWLVKSADADSLFLDDEKLWRRFQTPDPTWSADLRRPAPTAGAPTPAP